MREKLTSVAIAVVLALAVLVAYWPVHAHGFVNYDDPIYLTENPHVARGLAPDAIGWVFTHELAANYHPLTWLSHQLDVQIFGLERPGAHHMMSVALHALNAVLVFLLVRAAYRRDLVATLVAALFALHPLRVESVAWASERKDVLCATFFLATLLAHLRYARAPSAARYALVLAMTALALLAKPMAVSLPGVLLLLDFWPLRRFGPTDNASARPPLRRVLLEKVPLVALAGLAALVTFLVQGRGGSTSSLGDLGLDVRLLNALASLARIVAKSFWPTSLAVFYPHAALTTPDPRAALLLPAAAGLALLAAGTLVAWRARERTPAMLFGWLWFLGTLLPVIGIVQVGTQAWADRYTYLPAVGLCIAVVGGALALLPQQLALVASALAAVGLACTTRAQVRTWESSSALFEHARRVTGPNPLALAKLGEIALDEGDLERAADLFQQALAIQAANVDALDNLALVRLAQGELDSAQALLERALLVAPDERDTLLNLGAVALERADWHAARARFEACLALDPADADALYNLGNLAQRTGSDAEAERRFRAAIAVAPAHADAWSNLGQVLLRAGRTQEALDAFTRVVELSPEDPLAHFNLGIARRNAGDGAGARGPLQRALELDPTFEPAQQALDALARDGG